MNDFFQKSAFNDNDQLISFYYKIEFANFKKIKLEDHSFPLAEDGEKFRWQKIKDLHPGDVTFQVDKKVIEKLIIDYKKD